MPIRQYAPSYPGISSVPMTAPVAPMPVVNTNTGGVAYDEFNPVIVPVVSAPLKVLCFPLMKLFFD
jgi:hypothetical protein